MIFFLCGRFDKRNNKINMNPYHFEAGNFKEVGKYTRKMDWTIYNAAYVKNMFFLLFYDESCYKFVFIRHSSFF